MQPSSIHFACTLLLSSIVASGIASAEPVPTVDEATFVSELIAKHPKRAAIQSRVESARADIATARIRSNPTISFEREVPYADGTGFATNYFRINFPFDLSGRRGLEIDAASTGVRAANSDAAIGELELVIGALRVFDEAARARQHVEMLLGSRVTLARAVEAARQRGKAGDASGYQVQRFELELATHDDEILSAKIDLQRLRIQLASLVGRSGELDASATLALPVTVPSLDALLAKAASRGDLRAAQLRAESASLRAAAGGRGWIPMPSLMLGAMTADLGDQTGTGYVAGLSFTIPIFDRGQADRARAGADRTAALAATRVLEREIPTAVRIAHATFVARVEQARKLETTQIDRLDVILRAAETAFREGGASVVELLDAHRAARAVRVRALDLRYQVARDKRELELAMGQRL